MRVADFFCGAGGFSEGFRQKGFDVVLGVDNWRPAQETHKFNHPNCKHPGFDCFPEVKGDILAIDAERINEIVPDVDVIVGSPPCVSFSSSNKAGKADKGLGIQLIEKYLQIVAVKKHSPGSTLKYWVLENVPNSASYIEERYTFEDLGLDAALLKKLKINKRPKDIALETKQRHVFNAADFGAPQTRKRFVCGDYPEPKRTHDEHEWITMRKVMRSLSSPYSKTPQTITDPVYGFNISSKHLSDHFYDTSVNEHEWKRAQQLKEDHGFMGKMSFPETLDRPSRTIMATQSAVSRESIIFSVESKEALGKYRLPTIREISSFMSFPITYQFIGNNDSTKYKLIGNAVCVKLSASIADAIVRAEGRKPKDDFNPHKDVAAAVSRIPLNLNGWVRKQRGPPQRRMDAKFHKHVPYLKIRSFRVELDNIDSDFMKNRIVWRARLHQGSGMKSWKTVTPTLAQTERLIETMRAAKFKEAVAKRFDALPDAETLQLRFCRVVGGDGPDELLDDIKALVDYHFPQDSHNDDDIPNSLKNFDKPTIPARIAAALYATTYVVERVMATKSEKKMVATVSHR